MRYSQDTKFVISLTTSVLSWTFFMAESAVGCNTTMVCHKVGTGMNGLAVEHIIMGLSFYCPGQYKQLQGTAIGTPNWA